MSGADAPAWCGARDCVPGHSEPRGGSAATVLRRSRPVLGLAPLCWLLTDARARASLARCARPRLTTVDVYDRLHALRAKDDPSRPLDYGIPDRYWRKRSIDYIIMMLWQSFALLFTYPSM